MEYPLSRETAEANGGLGSLDLEALRLPAIDEAARARWKGVADIPIRKPWPHEWFRTHPDRSFWFETMALELSGTNSDAYFLIERSMWRLFEGPKLFRRVMFVMSITLEGVVFVWPCKLSLRRSADGRDRRVMNESALCAAETARSNWVRIEADRHLGMYCADVVFEAAGFGEPAWPPASAHDVLRIAFRDRFIHSADHPALQRRAVQRAYPQLRDDSLESDDITLMVPTERTAGIKRGSNGSITGKLLILKIDHDAFS